VRIDFIFSLGAAIVFYRKRISKYFMIQRSWFSYSKKHPSYSKIDEIILFLSGSIFIILSLIGLIEFFKELF